MTPIPRLTLLTKSIPPASPPKTPNNPEASMSTASTAICHPEHREGSAVSCPRGFRTLCNLQRMYPGLSILSMPSMLFSNLQPLPLINSFIIRTSKLFTFLVSLTPLESAYRILITTSNSFRIRTYENPRPNLLRIRTYTKRWGESTIMVNQP
jgi:hypothetical protein